MSEDVKQTELRDYIKDNVDLLDYITTFYPYINFKNGSTHKAVCPFPDHSENTGSFCIKDGTNFFKCFGCGESGDIFNFVMKMEGVEFADALNIIAENKGYNVTKNLKKLPNNQIKYFDSVITHNKRYRENLKTNDEAMEYLTEKRHISKETLQDFIIGFTDKKEYEWRDTLKGKINECITFPIFLNSPKKEIVANAYKPLKDNKEYKYINDGAEYIKKASNGYEFHKSELLYGYPQAYQHIRGHKKVYIVEGYFDVISMHEAGLKNTIGVMCSNISDMQMMAIKKVCNHVVLMLDNDIAGDKGKMDSIKRFLEYGFEVEVFVSKDLKDADDICKKMLYIKENVLEYIEDRTYDAITYFINESMNNYETQVLKAQKKAFKECCSIINSIQDQAEKSLYVCRIKKRLDIK